MEWYEIVMWFTFMCFVAAIEIVDNPTYKGFCTAAALVILGVYTFFVK